MQSAGGHVTTETLIFAAGVIAGSLIQPIAYWVMQNMAFIRVRAGPGRRTPCSAHAKGSAPASTTTGCIDGDAGAVPVGTGPATGNLGKVNDAKTPSSRRCNVEPELNGKSRLASREGAWLTAAEHARALLDWLQSPGGLTGEISAKDLIDIYENMIMEFRWQPRSWVSVAAELRKTLGGRKTYATRHGERVRVYRVPARTSVELNWNLAA